MLNNFLKAKLENNGFSSSELELEYSLSYSQGDGVAMYGRLDNDDLIKLIPLCYKVTKSQQQCLQYFIENTDPEVEISKNGHGYRYSHFNTMDLSFDDFSWAGCGGDIKNEGFDMSFSRFKRGRRHFAAFCSNLKTYIRDTSKDLERAGYGLLESLCSEEETIENKETKNTKVVVKTLVTGDFEFDHLGCMFDDEDHKHINSGESILCSLSEGSKKGTFLIAEVLDKSGNILGSQVSGFLPYDSLRDKSVKAESRYIVSEAVAAARYSVSQLPKLRA